MAAHAGGYRLHLLVGLVASLGLVTVAFRVPWAGAPAAVNWGAPEVDRFEVPVEEAMPETEVGLSSRYRTAGVPEPAPAAPAEAPEPVLEAGVEPEEEPPPPEMEKVEVRGPILEFAERSPELVGGLGSLYLRIQYPEAAIAAGVQGQLILRFVVEPDGRPSQIEVEKALHPLCDSAAVRALREVAFVPGRQNGEAVRVRMRLPVRFQLVSPSGAPLSDSALAAG
ncbi:MAG: energy transducer TonB [Rhodothermales bacterium]|nr:energy transducer TonB [Rhodothermales bacterium]